MSKLQDIRNLVQEHAVLVSSSSGDWMDYMDTASRLYRYSFSDQLLIHAQRPDATACASLELWNEKMLRWVNRGARGIALFDETWQNTKLRYVFDISDTHMVAGGRSPYLWQMQEHQREEILTHLAEVYALEEKDAATVKRFSRFVLNDEEAFAKELQALWNDKQADKPKQNQSELQRYRKRYDELTTLIRGLYENLISGLLPERQYKQLMKQYDDEQAELETKIEAMEQELAEEKVNKVDVKHFISLIRKYKEPTEISDLMFHELIDKIVVYEAEGVGKSRTQKVDIYFNYVGQVDIAYTEEELAEIKAQEEQKEMERLAKQRKREKAYREKRKAKKIAENGGEIVKKKVCPHCGKEFIPTSNRQIFCTKECCNQARQDKVKANRVAEKGDHYYRQRKCEVCGKLYWPTHSQQKFCSDECTKVNHNKKSLEFYHKKQKEKALCKDLSQMKEPVSSTNSSEITTIPA